ncbi:MAG TPA: universal stress protein [Clostridiales bacterium]|nr:universal stress protein [Clostridiales bacterium]
MEAIKNVMVCVTQQKTCERLIKKGAELREKNGGELYVIHVAKEGFNFLGKSKEGEALEYLFQKAKDYGANLTVVRAQNILETLKDFAEKNDIHIMVLGESSEQDKDNDIVVNLKKHLPEGIQLEIMPSKKK